MRIALRAIPEYPGEVMNAPSLLFRPRRVPAWPLAFMLLALLAMQAFTIAHAWHLCVPGQCPAQRSGHPLDCPFCAHHNLDGAAVQVDPPQIPWTLQSHPLPPSSSPAERRLATAACARDPPLP